MTTKGETWSCGANLRFPFNVNVIINLSIIVTYFCQNGKGKFRDLTKAFGKTEASPS